VVGARGNPGI